MIAAEGNTTMTEPQQPEHRRSERGGTARQDPEKERHLSNRPHGPDRGGKGGGRGSGKGDPRPPEQRPPHPA